VALDGNRVVGFASAVHYVHPDKQAELWVNEVGVASGYRRAGLAVRVIRRLFEVARELGCCQAWVLTDRSNVPATRLCSALGGVEAHGDVVMFEFPLEASPAGPTQE